MQTSFIAQYDFIRQTIRYTCLSLVLKIRSPVCRQAWFHISATRIRASYSSKSFEKPLQSLSIHLPISLLFSSNRQSLNSIVKLFYLVRMVIKCSLLTISLLLTSCADVIGQCQNHNYPTTIPTTTAMSTISALSMLTSTSSSSSSKPAGWQISTITNTQSGTVTTQYFCQHDGTTLPSVNLSPSQPCGPATSSLFAPANCQILPMTSTTPPGSKPPDVLERPNFLGCACMDDWGTPNSTNIPGSTVHVVQSEDGRCAPSQAAAEPVCRINEFTGQGLLCDCNSWLKDNTRQPRPSRNPCAGFTTTMTGSGTCTNAA